MVTMNEQLLTTEGAAAVLGVSPGVLGLWRFRKCGPPWIKINRRYVAYRPRDLETFLKAYEAMTARMPRLRPGRPRKPLKVRTP